jgi:ElaA protein
LIQIKWQWLPYEEMTKFELYASMVLRQEVFVVEQNCPYLDADGLDQHSWHLLGWSTATPSKLLAYTRVVESGKKYPEISIGRVATHPIARGTGIGRALMSTTLEKIEKQLAPQPIRISAQEYLLSFYRSYGFQPVSDIYMEDDIPHVEMLRP